MCARLLYQGWTEPLLPGAAPVENVTLDKWYKNPENPRQRVQFRTALFATALSLVQVPNNTLNFCGFETGDVKEAAATAGTLSVQANVLRSGRYALRVNPATTAVGNAEFSAHSPTTGALGTAFGTPNLYNRFYFQIGTAPSADSEEFFSVTDSSTAQKASFRINSSRNIEVYDSSVSLIATGATVLNLNQWYRIETRTSTGGGSQAYEVRLDGVTELAGVMAQTSTNHGSSFLGKVTDRNGETVDFYYDDWIADANNWVGPGRCIRLQPTSDFFGSWPAGTGASDFREVDEVPVSDLDYVATDDVDQEVLFGLISARSQGITGSVHAFKGWGRFKSAIIAVTSTVFRIQSNSVNSDVTNGFGIFFTDRFQVLQNDPATSATWSPNALENVVIGAREDLSTNVQASVFSGFVDHFSPDVPIGDWSLTQPFMPRKGPDRKHISTNPAFVYPIADTPEVVTLDKWEPRRPNNLFRAKNFSFAYPSFFAEPFNLTQGERITIDKWWQELSRPRFDLKRNQFIYPYFFGEDLFETPGAEVIRLDKWEPRIPNILFKAEDLRWIYPNIFGPPSIAALEAEISKYGFRPALPDLPNRLKDLRWVYPNFWGENLANIPPPEEITLDKWKDYNPDIIFRLKDLRWTFPWTFDDAQLFVVPPFVDDGPRRDGDGFRPDEVRRYFDNYRDSQRKKFALPKKRATKKLLSEVKKLAKTEPTKEQIKELAEGIYGKSQDINILVANIIIKLEVELGRLRSALNLTGLEQQQKLKAEAALKQQILISAFLGYEALLEEDELLFSLLI